MSIAILEARFVRLLSRGIPGSWGRIALLSVLLLLTVSGWLVGTGDAVIAVDIARLRRMHLNVDADRDGVVEQTGEDDQGDEAWEYGVAARGAIVLANSDDDDGDHLPDHADERVNAFPDEEDLAPLLVCKPGLRAFHQGARIVLSVASPVEDPPYFASVEGRERIRIFLPSRSVGDDLLIQAGDRAVIGPTAGDRVEFVVSPQPPQRDIAIFAGQGAVRFGVEGIPLITAWLISPWNPGRGPSNSAKTACACAWPRSCSAITASA